MVEYDKMTREEIDRLVLEVMREAAEALHRVPEKYLGKFREHYAEVMERHKGKPHKRFDVPEGHVLIEKGRLVEVLADGSEDTPMIDRLLDHE